MTIEAAGATRPIYEVGFWLSLLATNPLKALEELEIDEHDHAIKREKLLRAEHPDDATLIAASNERKEKRKGKLAKQKPISIKEMAETMPKDSGYLKYRIVSGFYGHFG